jgi:HSP20 family molecular chaperone IbpA
LTRGIYGVHLPRGILIWKRLYSQNHRSSKPQAQAATMKAFISKTIIFAALVAIVTFLSTAGASLYGSALTQPRSYQYHRLRDPLDLVSEIIRAPIYFNTMFKQQQEASLRLTLSSPRYAISENANAMELEVEVPGVSVKDLDIELEENKVLRIRGTRKHTEKTASVAESSHFDLTFQLSDDVEADRMTASLSAGILRLRVPKREKVTHKISIDTAEEANEEVVAVKHTDSLDPEASATPELSE